MFQKLCEISGNLTCPDVMPSVIILKCMSREQVSKPPCQLCHNEFPSDITSGHLSLSSPTDSKSQDLEEIHGMDSGKCSGVRVSEDSKTVPLNWI